MTPEEIDKMQPGRELNKLVALAMGQTDFEHLTFRYQEGVTEDGNDGWEGVFCPRCGEDGGECVKSYSQSYRYIEELLRWLVKNGGDLFIEYWSNGEWHLNNKNLISRYDVPSIRACSENHKDDELPNLPLALCRFILKVSENQ